MKSLVKKVEDRKPSKFVKNGLQHKCLPVNIAKFLGTFILKNICV